MMEIGAILFDLDGTLTDPYEGISKSVAHACQAMGIPVPDESGMRRFIGPPIHDSFAQMLGSFRAARVDLAVAKYRERFAKLGWKENRVYDGMPALLDNLRGAGARLYVATSKPTVFASKIIEHFGLGPRFERVYGSELDGSLSQKSELIAHILKRESLDPGSTLMVGDRSFDMSGAAANAVRAIGVLWGFGERAELEAAGATSLAPTVDELGPLIRSLPRRSDKPH